MRAAYDVVLDSRYFRVVSFGRNNVTSLGVSKVSLNTINDLILVCDFVCKRA